MKKMVLYGAFSGCLLLLSSCLGDPATSLTLTNQTGVVGLKPFKVVYVKGGQVVSSDDFQKAPVDEGECILFDYAIDPSAPENTEGAEAYKSATIYENTITEVFQWPVLNALGDTVVPVKNELTLSLVQQRYSYIKGKLFLFTEMNGHKPAQLDSFSLSYNLGQSLNNRNEYDLYLRTIQLKGDTVAGKSMVIPCAFDLEDFIAKAKTSQEGNVDVVRFRINYVSGFNKDTTARVWASSEVVTVDRPIK